MKFFKIIVRKIFKLKTIQWGLYVSSMLKLILDLSRKCYKKVIETVNFIKISAWFKKLKTFIFLNVINFLKNLITVYIINVYGLLKKGKPKRMSIFYFYWLQYSIIFYIGIILIIFFVLFVFQFEIILFYFPDIFILHLNDIMSDPQLSISGNSMLVDAYVYPELEKNYINISSLVGSSSYILFKYRRFVRNLQYMHSHNFKRPFWNTDPVDPDTFWDLKAYQELIHRNVRAKELFYSEDDIISNWIKTFMHFQRENNDVMWNSYRTGKPYGLGFIGVVKANLLQTLYKGYDSPLLQPGNPIYKYYIFKYRFLSRRYGKKNRGLISKPPLKKLKSIPFFLQNIYTLNERNRYIKYKLNQHFLNEIKKGSNIFETSLDDGSYYICDKPEISRVFFHREANVQGKLKPSRLQFRHIHAMNFKREPNKSREYYIKYAASPREGIRVAKKVGKYMAARFIYYYKNLLSIPHFFDVIYNSDSFTEHEAYINDIFFAQMQRYMISHIYKHSHTSYRAATGLSDTRAFNYFLRALHKIFFSGIYPERVDEHGIFRRDFGFFAKRFAFPYPNSSDLAKICTTVPIRYDGYSCYYGDLNLKYSKLINRWFRRYSRFLVEKRFHNRKAPYRFISRNVVLKQPKFMSDDVFYNMFYNYHSMQEPSGMGRSKSGYYDKVFYRHGDYETIDLYRKRYRDDIGDGEFWSLATAQPNRVFNVIDMYMDNFNAFQNYIIHPRWAYDAKSRESFWRTFFTRYGYKKKDYIFFYGKTLFDFDKYLVYFPLTSFDFGFFFIERVFTYLKMFIFNIIKRHSFFIGKPYYYKTNVDSFQVVEFNIWTRLLNFFKNYSLKLKKFIAILFKNILQIVIHLCMFFYNALCRFCYSFFNLSFILQKLFKLIYIVFNFFFSNIKNFIDIENVFFFKEIKKLLVSSLDRSNDLSKSHKNISRFSNLRLIEFFFSKLRIQKRKLQEYYFRTVFYNFFILKILQKSQIYFKGINFINRSFLLLYDSCSWIVFIFSTFFQQILSIFFLIKTVILNYKNISLNYIVAFYNYLKNEMLFYRKYLYLYLKNEIIGPLFGEGKATAAHFLRVFIGRRRYHYLVSFYFFITKGIWIKLYEFKQFIISIFILNSTIIKKRIKVFFENRNLRRYRYSTLILKNKPNLSVRIHKRRFLLTMFTFWASVVAFVYFWFYVRIIQLDMDDWYNWESFIFLIIPMLILLWIFVGIAPVSIDLTLTKQPVDGVEGFLWYAFESPRK